MFELMDYSALEDRVTDINRYKVTWNIFPCIVHVSIYAYAYRSSYEHLKLVKAERTWKFH